MFTDIHNHLAWDVDDGMDSRESAIQSLKQAKLEGITHIISTPHYIPGRFTKEDYDEITLRQKELIELGKEFGIQISLGSEIFMNDDYLEMFDSKIFHTLGNSKYVLIEFDVRKNIDHNEDVEDMLYEVKLRGYIPVIAHVERYFHRGLDVERIKDWIDSGCYVQINRTSLLGKDGSSKENAYELIRKNLAHVVATDTHSATGSRVCKMKDAYEVIQKEFGKECADILCITNGLNILKDKELLETNNLEKKSLFKRLFKKG